MRTEYSLHLNYNRVLNLLANVIDNVGLQQKPSVGKKSFADEVLVGSNSNAVANTKWTKNVENLDNDT